MTSDRISVSVDPDLEDLIPGFLENRGKDVQSMRAAVTAGNMGGLQSTGHSLKGVGGGYGFQRLSEIGAAIEQAAKAGDISGVPALLDEMEDYLSRVQVVYE